MKKFMSIALAAMMMASMSGCSGNGNSSGSSSAQQGEDKVHVGVVQIMEHTSLDTIRESFLDEMEVLGYGEDKVEYDIQNAQGEQSNLSTICKKFVGDDVDLIVAIATPTAQTAAASTTDIPSSRLARANSTINIAFFAASAINNTSPICTYTSLA